MSESVNELLAIKAKIDDLFSDLITKQDDEILDLNKRIIIPFDLFAQVNKFLNQEPYDHNLLNPTALLKTYYLVYHQLDNIDLLDTFFDDEFNDKFNKLTILELCELRIYFEKISLDNLSKYKYFMLTLDKFNDPIKALDVIISFHKASELMEFRKRAILSSKEEKGKYTLQEANLVFDIIGNFFNDLNKYTMEFRKKVKNIKKRNNLIDELMEVIDNSFEKGEFCQLTNNATSLIGVEVSHLINQAIIICQKKQYEDNEQKLSQLDHKVSQEHLGHTLKKYGLSIKMFNTKQLIMKYGNESVIASILFSLKQIGYEFEKHINDGLGVILLGATNKSVNEITHLISKNIIPISFIYNHPEVFIPKDNSELLKECHINLGIYDSFMDKYNLIKKYNGSLDDYLGELFINISIDDLKNNIINYQYYMDLFPKTNPLSFILNPNLLLIADFFIENNDDLSIINLDSLNNYDISLILKRLIISSNVSMDYISNKGKLLNSIISGISFIVPNQDLDDFTNRDIDYSINSINDKFINHELIKYLDDNYLNNGIYVFDDVYISKGKFLRNLSKYKIINPYNVFNALIKGINNEEDIDKINNALNNMNRRNNV